MSVKNPSEDELLEILCRFKETNSWPYKLLPVARLNLTDSQIEALVKQLAPARALDYVREELPEIAGYFCRELWWQEKPSSSKIRDRLERIRASASKLLREFRATDDDTRQTQSFVQDYMRQAAGAHGKQLSAKVSDMGQEVPWNFWTAHRLPSAIQSVELVEYWAKLAIATVDKERKRKTNIGKPAARALVSGLAALWQHAHGKYPGTGVESAFIRFTLSFIKTLQVNVTAEQERFLPRIKRELDAMTEDAVRAHLRTVKSQRDRLSKKKSR